MFVVYNKDSLKENNVLIQTTILDCPFRKEWQQDCSHVDHTYLDAPFIYRLEIGSANIVLVLISVQRLV